MKKDIKNKINEVLENMAYDLSGERSCNLFWGEVEVPECLKEELEEEK